MTIGERLKKVRKALSLNQKDFSEKLGINQSTVSQYESNITIPSNAVLTSIENLFGISKDWLVYGTGEMLRTANIQTITGHGNIQVNSGTVNTSSYADDVKELADLLSKYASPTFKQNLRDRLLKMKADSEI